MTGPGDEKRRIALVLSAGLAYALFCAIAITRSWPHHELLAIAVQYGMLLPALAYALRGGNHSPVLCWHGAAPVCILLFVVVASVVSWRVTQGFAVSDEISYGFQARILASGRLVAPAPPGAPEEPVDAPIPISFDHQIVSRRRGWFSKFPLGWPLVLALPEMAGLPWLANALLGGLLLLILGMVANEAFGPDAVLVATVMAALSPYFLAECVGRMSHTLDGVLIAASCLFCLQGIRTGKLSRFAWMFALLLYAFHVRPFTALVASTVLGLSMLIGAAGRTSGSFVRSFVRSFVLARFPFWRP